MHKGLRSWSWSLESVEFSRQVIYKRRQSTTTVIYRQRPSSSLQVFRHLPTTTVGVRHLRFGGPSTDVRHLPTTTVDKVVRHLPTTTVNQDHKSVFFPASLQKVPILLYRTTESPYSSLQDYESPYSSL